VIAWSALGRRSHPLREFARFLIVGVANTLLSFVTYRLLLAIGTPYVIAAPVSFAVGAVNGYIFNRRWTFAARDSMRSRAVYVVVQTCGAGLMTLLVFLLVDVGDVDRVLAWVAAIAPVTVSTFAANRLWTFADRAEAPAGSACT
jgi:putative flippase GtrA